MEFCQEKVIHEENVRAAVKRIPDVPIIETLCDIFKALSDPSRVKIVIALAYCELCVCDLAATCSRTESAVSHQLRTLRNLKIVKKRREGKIVYYRLDDHHVESLIQQSLEHVLE
jgi:ArsR family transcriptional regulator, lead/cadmium/zinc/bismuth-responsive transcriptional repressor